MSRNNITDYSTDPDANDRIGPGLGIDIGEQCQARGINNAIRQIMAHLKLFDNGTTVLTSPEVAEITVTTLKLGNGWTIQSNNTGLVINKDNSTVAQITNTGEIKGTDVTGSVNFD